MNADDLKYKNEKRVQEIDLFLDTERWKWIEGEVKELILQWEKEMHKQMAGERFNRAAWCSGYVTGLRKVLALPQIERERLQRGPTTVRQIVCSFCGATRSLARWVRDKLCSCGNILKEVSEGVSRNGGK